MRNKTMQKYVEREKTEEHQILLEGTVKSIREATVELSQINQVVAQQGEILNRIQRKIKETEITLRKASKKLSVLLRKSKNRKVFSLCLLTLTTFTVFTLGVYTYKYK